MPQTDFDSTLLAAKKLKNLIKNKRFTQLQGEVTVSIGIAAMPDERINGTDDILKITDDFLYEAKNSGKNRIIGNIKIKRSR